MQRDTLVLWCMYNGWGRDVSAERTGLGANTIRRAMRRFQLEPWLIFGVPVLHRGMFGKRPLWRCEVCLARLPGISEVRAKTHVAQPSHRLYGRRYSFYHRGGRARNAVPDE